MDTPLFIKQFFRDNRDLLSIEVFECKSGQAIVRVYNAVLFEKQKVGYKVRKTVVACGLDELREWAQVNVDAAVPVLLLIQGCKTIHRIHSDSSPVSQLAGRFIPGAEISQFFSSDNAINGRERLFSIARKDYCLEVLSDLAVIPNKVIKVSIGPFALLYVYNVAKELYREDKRCEIANVAFDHKESGVQDCSVYDRVVCEREYLWRFQDEVVPGESTVAFCHGLRYILEGDRMQSIDIAGVVKNFDRFMFSTKLRRLSRHFIMACAVLILVSQGFSWIVQGQMKELTITRSGLRERWEKQEQANGQRKLENEIRSRAGLVNDGKVSMYVNQITSTLPEDIYLNDMAIFPVAGNSDEEQLQFDNRILIGGCCYSGEQLDAWILLLKSYKWVSDVFVSEYTEGAGDGLNSFKIQIARKQ